MFLHRSLQPSLVGICMWQYFSTGIEAWIIERGCRGNRVKTIRVCTNYNIQLKVPRKYTSLVFGAIMGVLMSFVMSLLITVYTVGVPSNFMEFGLAVL